MGIGMGMGMEMGMGIGLCMWSLGLGRNVNNKFAFWHCSWAPKFSTHAHTHTHTRHRAAGWKSVKGGGRGGCSGMGQTKQMQSAMCFAFAASEPPYWG